MLRLLFSPARIHSHASAILLFGKHVNGCKEQPKPYACPLSGVKSIFASWLESGTSPAKARHLGSFSASRFCIDNASSHRLFHLNPVRNLLFRVSDWPGMGNPSVGRAAFRTPRSTIQCRFAPSTAFCFQTDTRLRRLIGVSLNHRFTRPASTGTTLPTPGQALQSDKLVTASTSSI